MNAKLVCPTCGNEFIKFYCDTRKLPKINFCSRTCKDIENWSFEQKLEYLKKSFFKDVIVKNGCWEWKGYKDKKGYAKLSCIAKAGTSYGNRASWMIRNGKIQDGLCVLHKCDNPECTNPDHLFLGEKKDNSLDMVEKNRSLKGSRHKKAKLKETDILNIRNMINNGITYKTIAEQFGVYFSTIQKIKSNKTWKHVREELFLM